MAPANRCGGVRGSNPEGLKHHRKISRIVGTPQTHGPFLFIKGCGLGPPAFFA